MLKNQKKEVVEQTQKDLKEAKSAILVDYSGLNMKAQEELKKRLGEVGARMIVVKNTLFKIAGEAANLPKEALDESQLVGQTALILANEDPISPLKVLSDFAKEFEVPQMKVGVVEGAFQDKDALVALSKLPGKEALQLQVLGSIASPIYGLVGTLNANMQKLISILDQASKKGGDK